MTLDAHIEQYAVLGKLSFDLSRLPAAVRCGLAYLRQPPHNMTDWHHDYLDDYAKGTSYDAFSQYYHHS